MECETCSRREGCLLPCDDCAERASCGVACGDLLENPSACPMRATGRARNGEGGTPPQDGSRDALWMLPRGMVIAGRFEVVRTLGKGGMGAVYQCQDRQLERNVALKRLLPGMEHESWRVSRLLAEARAIAAVNHPNIVQAHDLIEDPAGRFIVMEYVDGESLAGMLERQGGLSVRETTRVMLRVAMGLDVAHRKGIVHRDIKPANILIAADGTPKLGDFGIARLHSRDLTETGVGMGSIAYAAPEQLSDAKHVDARSDVFGLGATMYEMLTGHLPRHLEFDRLPEALALVVRKCLASDPNERYQTAAEFMTAVADAYGAYEKREVAPVAPAGAESARAEAAVGDVARERPGGTTTGRRRERILWRGSCVPWRRPGHCLFAAALVAVVLVLGGDLDLYARKAVAMLEHRLMAAKGFDADALQADEKFGLVLIGYFERIPYFWSALVLSVGLLVLPPLRSVATKCRLTSQRLTIKRGVLFRRTEDVPVREVYEVGVSQGLAGLALGYGDVVLRLRSGDVVVIEGLARPGELRGKTMRLCQSGEAE